MILASILGSTLFCHKSKVLSVFHMFQKLVERTFDKKILSMQTEGGGGGEESQKLKPSFA
jgi:hypothetical protein